VAELGGIGAALAATGCWLAVGKRGVLLAPALARRPAIRRALRTLALILAALSLRLFLDTAALAAAVLEWVASLTLALSLLVLAAPAAPRATRALVLTAAVLALGVFIAVPGGPAGGR
jgi:hypothetical protein